MFPAKIVILDHVPVTINSDNTFFIHVPHMPHIETVLGRSWLAGETDIYQRSFEGNIVIQRGLWWFANKNPQFKQMVCLEKKSKTKSRLLPIDAVYTVNQELEGYKILDLLNKYLDQVNLRRSFTACEFYGYTLMLEQLFRLIHETQSETISLKELLQNVSRQASHFNLSQGSFLLQDLEEAKIVQGKGDLLTTTPVLKCILMNTINNASIMKGAPLPKQI